MNLRSHNFLLIGLPKTGKTTFLAALWYAIQQTRSPTGLVLKKLDGDSGYLNGIRDAWLGLKPVGRNPTDTETFVSMSLRHRVSSEEVHLTFPDVSGESFREQWTARHLTASYSNCLRSANGGILFIHPESIVAPLRIAEVDDLAALIDDEIAEEAESSTQVTMPTVPWDIEKAPTQVQLVALLQFVMGGPHFKPPFRLAIAISAWDLVSASQITPRALLDQQMPLLSQFLSANSDAFTVELYGVSAQGGEYKGSALTELQGKNPASRIEIVGDGIENKHDITEPLLWLMQ